MRKVFTILVGFVHDFASGCWLATVMAVYWLGRQQGSPELAGILTDLKERFFCVGIVLIMTILATGAGRTLLYVNDVCGADAERLRKKMLIVKHIVLLAIFGLGTYWQYVMTYR